MRIGPHGVCWLCDGRGISNMMYCSKCGGTGRACPGGEVRCCAHFTMQREKIGGSCWREYEQDAIYICQTCGCIVDRSEVQE